MERLLSYILGLIFCFFMFQDLIKPYILLYKHEMKSILWNNTDDLCPFYDGQMVKILNIDDDNDTLNNKYGIIYNKYSKWIRKYDECGVRVDNKFHLLNVYRLIKIPTIFINGENHKLKDKEALLKFMKKESDDLIGLEFSDKVIQCLKNRGKYPDNVFGFDNDDIKQLNAIQFSNEDSFPQYQTKSSRFMWLAIAGSNDEILNGIESKMKVNLKEWRDKIIMGKVSVKDCKYLDEKTELSNKHMEIIDLWLELTKDYIIKRLREDEFVDDKFNFIYTELLDHLSNIFSKIKKKNKEWEQIRIVTMIRDIFSSLKIVEEYLKNYNEGKNIYIFIGSAHVKVLQHLVQQRLLKYKDNDKPTHVISQQIFGWNGKYDTLQRNEYFVYYAEKTGQTVDPKFLLKDII